MHKPIESKRSQSALEYMMTYGWAILIIVIVAVILYSMGIFSPSSSISSTVTGFSNLGSVTATCIPNQGLFLVIGDSIGYPIEITQLNVTFSGKLFVTNQSSVIMPAGTNEFLVPQACSNSVGSPYSSRVNVKYLEPYQILKGPYFSNGYITGKASSPESYIVDALTSNGQGIQVVSAFSNTIVKSFNSPSPYFVMKSPNGSDILFRSSLSSFSIVNMYNFNQVYNISIPNAGQGIYSLNGSYLYLLNGTGTSSDLITYSINSKSIKNILPIPTNCISTLSISKQGNIYISTENGWSSCGTSDENEVVVVSPSQGKIIKNITGFYYPVFLQPLNDTMWVGNWQSNTISVINTTNNVYIKNITTGPNPQAITYNNGLMYVTVVHSPNSSLLVINPNNYKIINNITLPNIYGLQVPGVAVASNGNIYISYRSSPVGHLLELSSSFRVIGNVTLGNGPYEDITINLNG
ncbi:MAG: YncE family protein [Candidatus Parvarchaeum sp.]